MTPGDDPYDPASYGDAFADVYDDWYADLDDGDFVARLAALMPNRDAEVLELGAGTGRLIDALRARRHPTTDHVVAVDASEAMLDRLRARQLSAVDVVCADMTADLGVAGSFDLVFVGYNTIFNVNDATALRNCLRNVAARLTPTGHFALDAVVPKGSDGETVAVKFATPTHVVLSVSNHDLPGQRISGEFLEFDNDECVRRRPWSVRYFTPHQIDDAARDAGLVLVSRHADGHGSEFTESSARHVSVYRRSNG